MEVRAQKSGGEGVGAASLQPSRSKFKKTHIIVDTTISKVLRDLFFIRNQPLKSADD
jgi:hypothetical protein